jgi:branched-chain amino acid transport system ATP-binding protein
MLELHDVHVTYGPVKAVRGVSLAVGAGEILALVGANGAGKSTLLEAISGIKRPIDRGSIRFRGSAVEGLDAPELVARGIAHVPENRLIFARMTVGENLLVAAASHLSRRTAVEHREKVLHRLPMLRRLLALPAASLSGGQRQWLAIGRGLMNDPTLILLDEPTLGLSPAATTAIFELLVALRAEGKGLLVVDQNVRQLLEIADRALVLDGGRVTAQGQAQALLTDPRMIEAYLGAA